MNLPPDEALKIAIKVAEDMKVQSLNREYWQGQIDALRRARELIAIKDTERMVVLTMEEIELLQILITTDTDKFQLQSDLKMMGCIWATLDTAGEG